MAEDKFENTPTADRIDKWLRDKSGHTKDNLEDEAIRLQEGRKVYSLLSGVERLSRGVPNNLFKETGVGLVVFSRDDTEIFLAPGDPKIWNTRRLLSDTDDKFEIDGKKITELMLMTVPAAQNKSATRQNRQKAYGLGLIHRESETTISDPNDQLTIYLVDQDGHILKGSYPGFPSAPDFTQCTSGVSLGEMETIGAAATMLNDHVTKIVK